MYYSIFLPFSTAVRKLTSDFSLVLNLFIFTKTSCKKWKDWKHTIAEFGQPGTAEIWLPLKASSKTAKQQKVIKLQKNLTISQYLWLKRALWLGFSFTLTLELAFYLYIEKQHKQKRKNSFLVTFLKQQFEATWKNHILKICAIFAFLLICLFWTLVRMGMCIRMLRR